MINRLEKFFCITPLLIALLCTSFVSGEQTTPPEDTHKEETGDCIENIRQKQGRIKQEIEKIKQLIKKDHRKDNRPNRLDSGRP